MEVAQERVPGDVVALFEVVDDVLREPDMVRLMPGGSEKDDPGADLLLGRHDRNLLRVVESHIRCIVYPRSVTCELVRSRSTNRLTISARKPWHECALQSRRYASRQREC